MSVLSTLTGWIVPGLILIALGGALARRVDVFGVFVEGAADGLRLAWQVLPYLITVWTAVGLFDRSGALADLVRVLAPVLHLFGIPAPVLPLFLIRPLSGSASTAIVAHLLSTYGPDSTVGKIASVVQASSETTLYVLTVYFGAVGVRRTLYALPVCLLGDVVGFAAALVAVRLFL
jgi:spore maturation protein B